MPTRTQSGAPGEPRRSRVHRSLDQRSSHDQSQQDPVQLGTVQRLVHVRIGTQSTHPLARGLRRTVLRERGGAPCRVGKLANGVVALELLDIPPPKGPRSTGAAVRPSPATASPLGRV
jgi:hypothetical protein